MKDKRDFKMDSYNLQSNGNLNDLGNTLIQWVKKVHEKRARKYGNFKRERYTDLIEMKGDGNQGRKESIWHS